MSSANLVSTSIATGSALLALAFAAAQTASILRADEGTELMRSIAGAIREGALAFLRREYTVVLVVGIVIAAILLAVFGLSHMRPHGTIMGALYRGLSATMAFAVLGLYLLDRWLMHGSIGVFIATLTGLAIVAALVGLTNYYTSSRFRPVARIAGSAEAGTGPVVITGMSVGLASVWLPGLTARIACRSAWCSGGTALAERDRRSTVRQCLGERKHRKACRTARSRARCLRAI